MKVKDAKASALRTGASVEYADGRRFNVGGLVSGQPLRPVPRLPVSPETRGETDKERNEAAYLAELAGDMRLLAAAMLQLAREPMTTPTPADRPAPIRQWEFHVHRDERGLIQTISATAK